MNASRTAAKAGVAKPEIAFAELKRPRPERVSFTSLRPKTDQPAYSAAAEATNPMPAHCHCLLDMSAPPLQRGALNVRAEACERHGPAGIDGRGRFRTQTRLRTLERMDLARWNGARHVGVGSRLTRTRFGRR